VEGAGVAGLGVVLRLELELDGEDGEDGEDGDDKPPEVLPVPDVARSAPRSQAAIMLAPRARDTATARVDTFMGSPC